MQQRKFIPLLHVFMLCPDEDIGKMFTIILIIIGGVAFVSGTILFGILLRRSPTKEHAEKYSRVVHFLYFAGLVFPGIVAFFYPGLMNLDAILGIAPLPLQPVSLVLGIIFLAVGLYFSAMSNRALRDQGQGANAFVLTKQTVVSNVYGWSRNPMSLGYYLVCVGIGLVAGSTFVTVGALLGLVPAHVFFLKYFEEKELELRFGEPYQAYKRQVPFLVPKWGAK